MRMYMCMLHVATSRAQTIHPALSKARFDVSSVHPHLLAIAFAAVMLVKNKLGKKAVTVNKGADSAA